MEFNILYNIAIKCKIEFFYTNTTSKEYQVKDREKFICSVSNCMIVNK
jgi:hypothetical protein